MEKIGLSASDHELVAAAVKASKTPVAQLSGQKAPAQVGAALRLDNGVVITSVNLTADVGSISLCAEPLAIAEANRQTDRKIDVIVAVYHDPGEEPKVVSPCGRCREVITDYASAGFVILRDPGTDALYKVRATSLLPLKYELYWKDGRLV